MQPVARAASTLWASADAALATHSLPPRTLRTLWAHTVAYLLEELVEGVARCGRALAARAASSPLQCPARQRTTTRRRLTHARRRVKRCSMHGRGLMSMDLQVLFNALIAVCPETYADLVLLPTWSVRMGPHSPMRHSPSSIEHRDRAYADGFIKVFYYEEEPDLLEWVTKNRVRCTGIADSATLHPPHTHISPGRQRRPCTSRTRCSLSCTTCSCRRRS